MNFFERIKRAVEEAASKESKGEGVYKPVTLPQEPEIIEAPSKKVSAVSGGIYLDYAATTPIDSSVLAAMKPYLETEFYNPSSIYAAGVATKQALFESRKRIATLMNVQADDIIFTSGGTESNNMALFGIVNAYAGKNAPHIITSTIEHPSILEVCKALENIGVKVTYIEPNAQGVVDPKKVQKAITDRTILVSIMHVNNEIGTIQPVGAIGRVVREFRGENQYPYFHVDASQAPNYLPIHAGQIGADLITLDATKVYGPRGVGLLWIRKGVVLEPLMYGGGQERDLRPGTENTAGIVGFSVALSLAQKMKEEEGERLFTLRELLISELKTRFPECRIHGEQTVCVPHIVNVCFPNLDAEFAVIKLDHAGIMVSSASACASNTEENYSTTVAALPEVGDICKRSSLRFSMGRGTTEEHIERLCEVLVNIVEK